MTAPPFAVTPLGKQDRSRFVCGRDLLDRYFQTQITQDVRRRVTQAFVATHTETETIAGFYTLSAAQIPFMDLDEDWRKKLPRYPTLPAVLVGRLAIDQRFQGQGLGSALLVDAVRRAMRSEIGMHFLLVDAIDEAAARFYRHLGLRDVPGDSRRLFVPLSVLARALES